MPQSSRAVSLPDSEPEPDLAAVRGSHGRSRDHHPSTAEATLVIEVSDSAVRVDRVGKATIYARAGLPVYRIVNMADKIIEVYACPSGRTNTPACRRRDACPVGTAVPVLLDRQTVGTVPVADLVG